MSFSLTEYAINSSRPFWKLFKDLIILLVINGDIIIINAKPATVAPTKNITTISAVDFISCTFLSRLSARLSSTFFNLLILLVIWSNQYVLSTPNPPIVEAFIAILRIL